MANKKSNDKTNKAAFIRRYPGKTPSEVVMLGRNMGLKFTLRYVRNVRAKQPAPPVKIDELLKNGVKSFKPRRTGYLGEKTVPHPALRKASQAVARRLDEIFWENAADRLERIVHDSFMPALATAEAERRFVELAVEIGLTRAAQIIRQAAAFDHVMSVSSPEMVMNAMRKDIERAIARYEENYGRRFMWGFPPPSVH